MSKNQKTPEPLTNTSGEACDDVTKTNQEMERKFEGENEDEVPRADRVGGLRGNPG